MPRAKRVKPEEIITKLRQAEVELAKGMSNGQACRKIEVTPPCCYHGRKIYGGMEIGQAKRLKDMERENARLKKIVADQALDIVMLKDVASGNF